MFQLGFYSKYFDLDSDMFFRKLLKSMNPLDSTFSLTQNESTQGTRELYGFFWITGSLVFMIFVSSTGSNILASWLRRSPETSYQYSFDLLTMSIILFYGYTITVPMILYIITTFLLKFQRRLSLVQLVSLYGYTNTLWFPITLINFLLVAFVGNNHKTITNLLEWIIVMLSGVVTGLSNLIKLSPIIKENCLQTVQGDEGSPKTQYYYIIGVIVVTHIAFSVLVKVSFFGVMV